MEASNRRKRVCRKKENVKDIVQSLVGAIPYIDKTLSELRGERLRKDEIYKRVGFLEKLW